MATREIEADRCAVCRRHFLQGEAVRLYREPGATAFQRVCPLCGPRASRRGWEPCEATQEVPLQVHADPARMVRALQRDRLVEHLQHQLESVQDERDSTRTHGERERENLLAEIGRLRETLNQARLEERRLERAERRLRELDGELRAAAEELARVRRARRREADPANLRRIAAEAFNRSPYANEIRQAGRTLGQPQCGIVIEGIGLPRRLRLVFAWEHTLRELLVEVDLVERSLDVAPAGRSDDAGRASFPQNAAWTPANGLIADP